MTEIDKKTDAIPSQAQSDLPSHQLPFSRDCSPFLNWDEEQFKTVDEQAVVFQSLVATLKFQPALDASLEAKAVKLLESVDPDRRKSANEFLRSFGPTADDSLTEFVQSIVVLISSAAQVITTATMKMLHSLMEWISTSVQFTLVQAGLVPQLINTLNPQSLSFSEAVDIHACLMTSILRSLWLATPESLEQLGIEDEDEQQIVHETFLKQIVAASEPYVCHLCVNRFSIVDGEQSKDFLTLLAYLLEICPYHQPKMAVVVNMPVVLTIPGCLTFFENENSIWVFLFYMVNAQWEWNWQGGEVPQMGTTVLRMLRMEGIEDVMEEKMQNDKNGTKGGKIVNRSIEWNNLLGMNLPEQE
ncbi:hypothetical protein BLNAU_16337 [Blattamonas nauphoetae]|uniref:Uncharacterized protein n=1 Tax=Blattamonas nauphoetae TaxID=2049346 RepID=A0ABQ9XCV8_9EUKA|nr:hypothetical protein BLNAU_16337 [Blattamonas nauphoetae]